MKKLIRNGKAVRMDKKRLMIDFETYNKVSMDLYLKAMNPMQMYGGKPELNPYSAGPFTIKKITVARKRAGVELEVEQRWLVDKYERPLFHGTRKQLDKKLKQYETGYIKWLMTRGTAAEGI